MDNSVCDKPIEGGRGTMPEAIALPKPLQPLAGRIYDTDSHEMMPAQT